jgi:hypothetical protein
MKQTRRGSFTIVPDPFKAPVKGASPLERPPDLPNSREQRRKEERQTRKKRKRK